VPAPLNRLTRRWWRTVGREVDLAGSEAWLDAPMSVGPRVRDDWLAAEAVRIGGKVVEDLPNAGLLADMAALDGPGFRASELRAEVRDFYEHTSGWRMEVWAGWTPLFWPGGEIVSRLFGRRSEQLALPMRPLDVARGMDSRVVVLADADGNQHTTGWLRTLRATGEYVYSGAYGHRRLPGADRDSVHVAFPLESGNVQVFLRPDVGDAGSLWLRSPATGFGSDGAYVVVAERRRTFAARAPLRESFHVYVDDEGVLRTDHELRLWNARVVRLHYKLERRLSP
jgi:hypothetical protein